MRFVAWILVLAALACVGSVAHLYLTADVTVEVTSVQAIEAVRRLDTFNELRRAWSLNAAVGTLFVDQPIGPADDYQLITYQLKVNNTCLMDAETVEAQITPMAGDVMQLPEAGFVTVPSGGEGSLTVTLLTDIHMHPVRELTVTWYMGGQLFSKKVRVTVN